MVFQFLNKLIIIFKAYFGGKVTEEELKENFALVYELLDGMLHQPIDLWNLWILQLLTYFVRNIIHVHLSSDNDPVVAM